MTRAERIAGQSSQTWLLRAVCTIGVVVGNEVSDIRARLPSVSCTQGNNQNSKNTRCSFRADAPTQTDEPSLSRIPVAESTQHAQKTAAPRSSMDRKALVFITLHRKTDPLYTLVGTIGKVFHISGTQSVRKHRREMASPGTALTTNRLFLNNLGLSVLQFSSCGQSQLRTQIVHQAL